MILLTCIKAYLIFAPLVAAIAYALCRGGELVERRDERLRQLRELEPN